MNAITRVGALLRKHRHSRSNALDAEPPRAIDTGCPEDDHIAVVRFGPLAVGLLDSQGKVGELEAVAGLGLHADGVREPQ